MQHLAFCFFAIPIGNDTANNNGNWLNTVHPPCRNTFQHLYYMLVGAARPPMIACVVNRVPIPTEIPANANRSTGVNIAPPNF